MSGIVDVHEPYDYASEKFASVALEELRGARRRIALSLEQLGEQRIAQVVIVGQLSLLATH